LDVLWFFEHFSTVFGHFVSLHICISYDFSSGFGSSTIWEGEGGVGQYLFSPKILLTIYPPRPRPIQREKHVSNNKIGRPW